MIQMLIVDDERIDREGVAYLIRKYGYPIEMQMAESGEEALAILESRSVDILFTDICMPEQNGLELIRQVRERCPALELIIYSAYGEFEYARQAIQYGVKHYILKPLKLDEFQATMQSVVEECLKNKRDRQEEELLRLLLLGQMPETDFEVNGTLVLVDLSRPLFADPQYPMEQVIQSLFRPTLCVSLNEFQAVMVLPEDVALQGAADAFCHRVEEDTGAVVTVVLDGTVRTPQELLDAYTRMDTSLDARFFSSGSSVLNMTGEKGTVSGDYLQQSKDVENYILRHEKARAIAETARLFEELEQNGDLSPMYVRYLCSNLVHCCTESNTELPVDTVSEYVQRLFRCPNIYALRDVMMGILDEAMPDEEGEQSVIHRVLKIVEQEYMKDISLEQIADRVELSPSYLSFYFKKETGRNFIKYLTVFRLEKAKQLLRTTDIKVITISEMVGYLSSSYFCLLFKNYTGKTPARFREEAV